MAMTIAFPTPSYTFMDCPDYPTADIPADMEAAYPENAAYGEVDPCQACYQEPVDTYQSSDAYPIGGPDPIDQVEYSGQGYEQPELLAC